MPKTDITVRELVDKVQRGELTLPEMQRPYVWRAARVRDLLDSLYRGYPSGTILTWETDEEIESRSLAVNPRNPGYPIIVATVLDARAAAGGSYAKAAHALGLTTSQLLRFLRSDTHLWRVTQQHGNP